ncbi:SMI1/KNR4 family protein [Pseudomonas viridiflava]|nr:SMI1/KNR4 family protein [Pseudomonas viridiflava]MEE4226806.1 SMI1/KNR4 family protein [Pseudomonas viridiflava]
MITDPFRIPTDAEIAKAERSLNFPFPAAYIDFLKSGSDVANASFEPAVILPGSSHVDLFEIAHAAWNQFKLPKKWLPFIEDNGDYFCVSQKGEVKYWSHNGPTDEKWPDFSSWFEQVCVRCE